MLDSEPVAVEVASEPTPVEALAQEQPGVPAAGEAIVVEPQVADPYANDEWPSAEEVTSAEPQQQEGVETSVPAPVAVAVEPAPADQQPASSDPASENELRFTTPGTGSAKTATKDRSEPALIKLAIRPRDIETLESPESADEPADEPQPARAAKSELTPLQVQPIPVAPEEAPKVAQAAPQPAPVDQKPAAPPEAQPVAPPAPQVQAQAEPAAQPPQQAQVQPAVEPVAPPRPDAQPQPLAPPRKPRSPAVVATLARADERARHGIQLAQKGALYAARREFTTAVKLIAQANDVDNNTRDYTKAAIAGFTAMKEANDLLSPAAAMGEIEVAALVGGHKTPILKGEELIDMPATVAAGYYYNYAKDQLAEAIGHQTVGSIALYGLGKIIIAGAGTSSNQLEYTGPAMALYQAALLSEPQNYRAAHELGVLLAGAGQLEAARELLIASATRSPQPVIWRNLATVHTRMGEQQLAAQAQQRADALAQTNQESKGPNVTWVDPATFAASSAPNAELQRPAANGAKTKEPAFPQQTSAPAKPAANVAGKKSYEWNPLNLRR
jgi:hypothetical protein